MKRKIVIEKMYKQLFTEACIYNKGSGEISFYKVSVKGKIKIVYQLFMRTNKQKSASTSTCISIISKRLRDYSLVSDDSM